MLPFINFNILSSSQLCANFFVFLEKGSFQLVIASPTKKGHEPKRHPIRGSGKPVRGDANGSHPKRGVSVRSNSCVPKIYQISD